MKRALLEIQSARTILSQIFAEVCVMCRSTVKSRWHNSCAWRISKREYILCILPILREIAADLDKESVQFSSVAQSCLTLCDPMNCSTPGLPVHHQLPEFTQTPVHRVGDPIQPSHPLLSPPPPAFNPSQHQGLFQ